MLNKKSWQLHIITGSRFKSIDLFLSSFSDLWKSKSQFLIGAFWPIHKKLLWFVDRCRIEFKNEKKKNSEFQLWLFCAKSEAGRTSRRWSRK